MHRYLEVLRSQARPLRFLTSRVLMRTGSSRQITFARNGYRLRFHKTALSAALWINPEERVREERFLAGCLETGDTVIDVGANIGTISLACAQAVGEQGHILAIEPHPVIHAVLSDNIDLNGLQDVIVARKVAVGREAARIFLTDTSDDTQTMITETAEGAGAAADLVPLDTIAPKRPVALIKLDAEGYEPEIIAGSGSVCARTRMIYTEFDPGLIRKHGADPGVYLDTLRSLGFTLFHVEGQQLAEIVREPAGKDMLIGLKNDVQLRERVEAAAARSWGR